VAVAAVTALVVDRDAAAEALEAVAGTEQLWGAAARCATTDPRLADAATRCLGAAAAALRRGGASDLATAVDRFAATYTSAGRCPADDVLAAWPAEGDGHAAWPSVPLTRHVPRSPA
jgi:glutamate--cysteine ligase